MPSRSLAAALAAVFALPAVAATGLHGQRPADPSPAPSFTVQNQAGEPRGPADLVGQPHVLWFYPMAGTPG